MYEAPGRVRIRIRKWIGIEIESLWIRIVIKMMPIHNIVM
jgi:hypothetical protein